MQVRFKLGNQPLSPMIAARGPSDTCNQRTGLSEAWLPAQCRLQARHGRVKVIDRRDGFQSIGLVVDRLINHIGKVARTVIDSHEPSDEIGEAFKIRVIFRGYAVTQSRNDAREVANEVLAGGRFSGMLSISSPLPFSG